MSFPTFPLRAGVACRRAPGRRRHRPCADRNPVLAFDDRRPRRSRQQPRQAASTRARSSTRSCRCSRARIPSRWPPRWPPRARAIAPHIVQVFEVGTATMMASGKAIKPVLRGDGAGGREVRPEVVHPGRGGLLLHAVGPDAVVPVQQLDAGVLLTTRTRSRRRDSTRTAAQDVAGGDGRGGQAQGVGREVQLHDRLAVVGAVRDVQRLARPAVRHQAERLRRHRPQARDQRTRCRSSTCRT